MENTFEIIFFGTVSFYLNLFKTTVILFSCMLFVIYELIGILQRKKVHNGTVLGPKGRPLRRTYLSNDYPVHCILHDKPRLLLLLATTIITYRYPFYRVRNDLTVRQTNTYEGLVITDTVLVCVVINTINAQRMIGM